MTPVWEEKNLGLRVFHGTVLDVPVPAGGIVVPNALRELPADSYNAVVTSPPFWGLRAYLKAGDPMKAYELGSEPTPEEYLARQVEVFREVRRVLHPTGVCWIEIGDTTASEGGVGHYEAGATGQVGNTLTGECRRARYSGSDVKVGEPCNIPHRLAEALRADGWFWRATIVWHHVSAMPESVAGWRWQRCRVKVKSKWNDANPHPSKLDGINYERTPGSNTAQYADCPGCPKCRDTGGYVLRRGRWRPTHAHSYILMLTKSAEYFCDDYARREPACAATVARNAYGRIMDDPDEQYAVAHDHEFTGATRNPRDVQAFPPEPCKYGHYAAFPSSIPLFCLKPSVSPKGRCPQCGTPWSPVVENEVLSVRPPENGHQAEESRLGLVNTGGNNVGDNSLRDGFREMGQRVLGYRPSCRCPAHEPEPCRVLDPYAGTGTTLAAAMLLGCYADGIELNPAYIEMIPKRIGARISGASSGVKSKIVRETFF